MVPQGSQTTDTAYIDNLIARVNKTDLCADLQAVANEAMASLQAHVAATEAQIKALLPFQALLQLPTDLPSLLTWVQKLVAAQIAPQVVSYTTHTAQLAALITKIGQLAAAVETAASRIGNCSASAPTLTLSQ